MITYSGCMLNERNDRAYPILSLPSQNIQPGPLLHSTSSVPTSELDVVVYFRIDQEIFAVTKIDINSLALWSTHFILR